MQSDENCSSRAHLFPFVATLLGLFIMVRVAQRTLLVLVDVLFPTQGRTFNKAKPLMVAVLVFALQVCLNLIFHLVKFCRVWNVANFKISFGLRLILSDSSACFALQFTLYWYLQLAAELGIISCWTTTDYFFNAGYLGVAAIFNSILFILPTIYSKLGLYFLIGLALYSGCLFCVIWTVGRAVDAHFAAKPEIFEVRRRTVSIANSLLCYRDGMIWWTSCYFLLGAFSFKLDISAPCDEFWFGTLINLTTMLQSFALYRLYLAWLAFLGAEAANQHTRAWPYKYKYCKLPLAKRLLGHFLMHELSSWFVLVEGTRVPGSMIRLRSCPLNVADWGDLEGINEKGESNLDKTSADLGESKIAKVSSQQKSTAASQQQHSCTCTSISPQQSNSSVGNRVGSTSWPSLNNQAHKPRRVQYHPCFSIPKWLKMAMGMAGRQRSVRIHHHHQESTADQYQPS